MDKIESLQNASDTPTQWQRNLLTLSHLACDICQGAIPALLPFLMAELGLSYTKASALVMACSIISSVIQPLFGYLGDRINTPWFMGLGVLLAGIGVSLIGWTQSYWQLVACTAITGIGVALFHPEGGKLANILASKGKASGLSNFSVGGYAGFAIGPVLVMLTNTFFDLKGTTLFIIPSALVAWVIFGQSADYHRFSQDEMRRRAGTALDGSAGADDWLGFAKITTVNFLRSIISSGINVFMPLFLITCFLVSSVGGAMALACYSFAGAVATFIGGRIADRFGMKRMVLFGFGLACPLLVAFMLSPNLVVAVMLIMMVALSCGAAYSSIIVLGQNYLPNRLGLASGISMGVVVSVGGVASTFLGMVGDRWGLMVVMAILCGIAALTAAASALVYRHHDLNN